MEATTTLRDTDVLCTTIVEAVADHTDADPLSMTPLATVVDPEALDALVNTGTDVQVSFEYEGTLVHVRGDDTVVVDGTEYDDAADGEGR